MRDLKKEVADSDAKVEAADYKVLIQSRLVADMHHADPQRPAAERLLGQMRHSASSAGMNSALMQYDAENERTD